MLDTTNDEKAGHQLSNCADGTHTERPAPREGVVARAGPVNGVGQTRALAWWPIARPETGSKKCRLWVSTTSSMFWPGRTWLRELTRAVHSDLSPTSGRVASSSSPASAAATVSW